MSPLKQEQDVKPIFALFPQISIFNNFFLVLSRFKQLLSQSNKSYLQLSTSAFLASWLARSMVVMITFPLEYKSIALYGQKKFTTKIDKSVNKNVFTGLFSMYLNNVLFSVMFWPLAEMAKKYIKNRFNIEKEYYVMPLSALVAGQVCATVTYPFDLIRILKISYEDRYGGKTGLSILKDIYKTGGLKYFFAGKLPLYSFKNLNFH